MSDSNTPVKNEGMRPKEIAAAVEVCLNVQRPAMIWGPPGVGKSEVIEQIAVKRESELSDVRLGMMDVTEIKGFPVPDIANGEMVWLRPDFLPPMLVKEEVKISAKKTETQLVPNKSRGILFLDEINQAPPMVQAASYQLLLNRRVGKYTLPENWGVLAAGNREADRANAQRMPSALSLRLVHLDYAVNIDDWCDWALTQGDKVPVELLAFLRFRPGLLNMFDPKERSSPNPRSWVFCGQMTHSGLDPATEFAMFSGAVGKAAAGEYKGFLQVFREVPTVDQVKLDPEGTPIPTTPAAKFAISAALAHGTSKELFPRFMAYMSRMDPEWRVSFVRDAQRRTNRAICETREYQQFAIKYSNVLA